MLDLEDACHGASLPSAFERLAIAESQLAPTSDLVVAEIALILHAIRPRECAVTTLATEHEVAFIGLPSRHRQLPLVVPLILLMHPFISDSIGVSHDTVT